MGKRVHDDLVGIFLFCMHCALVPAPFFRGTRRQKGIKKKGRERNKKGLRLLGIPSG